MSDATRPTTSRHAWLQLLRPANVVTSMADVLAGYGVSGQAAGPALGWLVAGTVCLYAGGVVLNDFFDRHLDAVERPERPIPSRRISAMAAGSLGAFLLLAGVLAASVAGPTTGVVGAGVALAVLLYDARGKHGAFVGPVNMGLCRSLNLLLGIAAAPAVLATHWPLGLLPLVYIAAVTMVSRGEVHGGRKPVAQAALGLVAAVVATLGVLAFMSAGSLGLALGPLAAIALTLLLGWRILPAFVAGTKSPDPSTLRTAVRAGVLSLFILDAVIAAVYADIIYCLAILVTGVAAGRLARLFAVT